MIAIRASPLFVYQGRPVLVAASLADLRGPTSGVVELPLRLYWSAPDRIFSLDDLAERQKVYTIVVREARRPDDLAVFLDGGMLIALWPDIFLPGPVRRAWEDEYPGLRSAALPAVLYPGWPVIFTTAIRVRVGTGRPRLDEPGCLRPPQDAPGTAPGLSSVENAMSQVSGWL